MRDPSKPLRLRVISYNVLSSHLASPSHFTTLNPDHLEASKRLPVVLKKLEEEMDGSGTSRGGVEKNAGKESASSSSPGVIVCLQEVSYDWAGALHTFFSNRGYHFVTGLYGKRFNGYMGVGLAWPVIAMPQQQQNEGKSTTTSVLETVSVDISRLSDKREKQLLQAIVGGDDEGNGGDEVRLAWPPKDEEPGVLSKWWSTAKKQMQNIGLTSGDREETDHWQVSEWRSNVILTATLRDKETGQSFCIANYHMPCAYYAPKVMTIHADMAARHVQRIAEEQATADAAANAKGSSDGDQGCRSLPCILAGDFNLKPSEPVYKLLTTREMDKDDPFFPTPKNGYEWTPSSKPMASAYAAFSADNSEPDFTNYARIREEDPFIDTLDYIFLSPPAAWNVKGVRDIPKRDAAGGPFPNLDAGEPSDHVLISADLELGTTAGTTS